MTINEALNALEPYQQGVAIWLVTLPVATYTLGAGLKACAPRLMRIFLAIAIYLAVIPGTCMAVILLYMFFFARLNLLREMHLVLHLLPVVSMLATLGAAARLSPFAAIPGFDRLQGLVLLVGLSFGGLLFLHKTFVGIHFFARFEYLLLLFVGFLILWRLAAGRLFGRRSEAPR